MFKSSTALFFALALSAPFSWAQQGNQLKIQPNAPDRYVVVKGDTLWDISGRFLKDAWRWPEIWGLNKEQIRDPHWIYPGDVVVFDRDAMRLHLVDASGTGVASGVDRQPCVRKEGESAQVAQHGNKLQPCIREESIAAQPIPTIPAKLIDPFLSQPLVTERDGLDNAPRIVATQEGRYNLGPGNLAYAEGISSDKSEVWNIYRPGQALIDPDSKKALGYEAVFLGTARVVGNTNPTTLQVSSAKREIGKGDRLIAATPPKLFNYVPHAPEQKVHARVMSVYGGNSDTRTAYYGADQQDASKFRLNEAGPLSIVTVNKGSVQGLEVGDVLAFYRGTVLSDDHSIGPFYMGEKRADDVHLPVERFGLVMVFRTFDNVSYALVMQAERAVGAGDLLLNP